VQSFALGLVRAIVVVLVHALVCVRAIVVVLVLNRVLWSGCDCWLSMVRQNIDAMRSRSG
jgi:hypothetical protein